jgi:hypothetical protein
MWDAGENSCGCTHPTFAEAFDVVGESGFPTIEPPLLLLRLDQMTDLTSRRSSQTGRRSALSEKRETAAT